MVGLRPLRPVTILATLGFVLMNNNIKFLREFVHRVFNPIYFSNKKFAIKSIFNIEADKYKTTVGWEVQNAHEFRKFVQHVWQLRSFRPWIRPPRCQRGEHRSGCGQAAAVGGG